MRLPVLPGTWLPAGSLQVEQARRVTQVASGQPGLLARHTGATPLGSCRMSRPRPEGRKGSSGLCSGRAAWALERLLLGCDLEREITK